MPVWSVGLVFASHLLCQGRREDGDAVHNRKERGQFSLQRHEPSVVCGNSKSHANISVLLLLLPRAVDVMSVTAFRAAPGAFEQTFSPAVDILVASERWPPVAHNGMVAG